jgi:hypothetical protein
MRANCAQEDKNSVMQILRVSNVIVEEKYLGLPTLQGRMCKNKFKPTKERLAKWMPNYAERLMFAGAKEVLIKSVVQAIPTYVMGVFKLPTTLCEEMEQIIRYFGGEGRRATRICIGWPGRNCCNLNVRVDLASGI